MTTKPKTTYQASPFGTTVHPWINKPDTKFNEAGLFKAPIRLSGKVAEDFKAKVDAQSDAYFEETTAEMTAGERKKWSVYYPYKVEEDDDGNPTGTIVFDFKQNATIRLKDGTTKAVKISIQDSQGNDSNAQVFGGSEIRTMFSFRGIKMVSTKQAGIRLDFSMVQIKKLVSSGGSGRGFDAVEDGYVDEGDGPEPPTNAGSTGADTGGDY